MGGYERKPMEDGKHVEEVWPMEDEIAALAEAVKEISTDPDFDGEISNWHIFSKELNIVEVNQIKYLPGSVADGLITYLPFWGDSTEPDLAENSNTGTVTGSIASSDGPPVMFGGGLPL